MIVLISNLWQSSLVLVKLGVVTISWHKHFEEHSCFGSLFRRAWSMEAWLSMPWWREDASDLFTSHTVRECPWAQRHSFGDPSSNCSHCLKLKNSQNNSPAGAECSNHSWRAGYSTVVECFPSMFIPTRAINNKQMTRPCIDIVTVYMWNWILFELYFSSNFELRN